MTVNEMTREIIKLIDTYAPRGTKFKWDKATSRFGSCRYKYNRNTHRYYNFVITISYPLASRNEWEEVRNTVLHEIAHARTPGHNHDATWKRECLAIGGDGKRCYRNTEQGGTVIAIPKKYIGTCPCCGQTFMRDRIRKGTYHCNRHQTIVWKINNNVA